MTDDNKELRLDDEDVKETPKRKSSKPKKKRYEVVLVTPTHVFVDFNGTNLRVKKTKDVSKGDKIEI